MGPFKNTLLKSLDAKVVARLGLRRITFELKHEMEYPGKIIDHLYFVEDGMASQTTTFQDGSQVEVGMFGYESVVGVSALMGTKRALNRVYTQIAGYGHSCTLEAGRAEFALGGVFQKLTLRYVQAQLVQVMQSAGCNIKHTTEERLARWLLLCSDRAHNHQFLMSHEFLSDMLGSSRPTVSVAAALLKDEGLIEYSRGKMHLLDVTKLEARSCECYRVIKDHLDSYAEFEGGTPVN